MVEEITRPAMQDAEIKRMRILLEHAQPLLAAQVRDAKQEGQALELAEIIRRMLANGVLS